jgi:hypothetical protein
VNVEGCLACGVLAGRIDVPGGTIAETQHWDADHCLGPFGVGAVVVKSKEHVEALCGNCPPAREAAEAAGRLRACLHNP